MFQLLVKSFYGFAFFWCGDRGRGLVEDQRNEGISVEVGHIVAAE